MIVSSEMSRGGMGIVASLLYQLLSKYWKSHRVPNDWYKEVIIPFYIGKGLRQVKAYDRVKGNDLWRTLSMYGVSSGLIQVLQSPYRGYSACVRIKRTYLLVLHPQRSQTGMCSFTVAN
ncbi:hypothetical protein EVAR_57232_1 [Eumeta japonica]|uniref:Uncharacterized protein n=1 Tax=Eumeta variegata TaxID=151549 RepID=A0A4C1ZK27_EUMVA|nr:hypothetical protein EVAR_57232_1 [Eumeta japonica]